MQIEEDDYRLFLCPFTYDDFFHKIKLNIRG